jgi:acyl carrier protein
MDNLVRLKAIFEQVLKMEIADFSRDTSPASVAEWDSMMHTNLVLATEKSFGFEFTLDEIPHLESVGDFLDIIAARLAKVA